MNIHLLQVYGMVLWSLTPEEIDRAWHVAHGHNLVFSSRVPFFFSEDWRDLPYAPVDAIPALCMMLFNSGFPHPVAKTPIIRNKRVYALGRVAAFLQDRYSRAQIQQASNDPLLARQFMDFALEHLPPGVIGAYGPQEGNG